MSLDFAHYILENGKIASNDPLKQANFFLPKKGNRHQVVYNEVLLSFEWLGEERSIDTLPWEFDKYRFNETNVLYHCYNELCYSTNQYSGYRQSVLLVGSSGIKFNKALAFHPELQEHAEKFNKVVEPFIGKRIQVEI